MKNIISPSGKLSSFPRTYYVTLKDSFDRQGSLEKHFLAYGIYPERICSDRFSSSFDDVRGQFIEQILNGVYRGDQVTAATIGCLISHLKAIQLWLASTTEEIAFFCEDDLSLETVSYWNFTWNDFYNALPADWEAVQLLIIREKFDEIKLRPRVWNDWAHSAYILKRPYAKRLLARYVRNDHYHLEITGTRLLPIGENVLFSRIGQTYSVPLFVEDIELGSTFDSSLDIFKQQKPMHRDAANTILNWWKSSPRSINDLTS